MSSHTTLLPPAQPVLASNDLPVAVIGAGPVGLAAVARLIESGIKPLVFETGNDVGTHLLDYGHVRLFSPWRYNVDPVMARLLGPTGWTAPPDDALPLARDVVERVLRPFARLPVVAPHLHLGAEVLSISRDGFDKVKTVDREKAAFVIRVRRGGEVSEHRARAVIDASGTWSRPNPLGANGLAALGEEALADAIFYGIPDVLGVHRARYAGKRTLVVGAGHSAANALLALAELARRESGTQLVWAVRSPVLQRVFGGGVADALPARGQLGSDLQALRDRGGLQFVAGLRISAVRRAGDDIHVDGRAPNGDAVHLSGIDQIVCATGQRPDLSLASELRVKLDPWLESTAALGPLIDPNVHSCGTVRPHGHRELAHPEPGFYTVGVKSYGRAPTFLMATGFEQARSVVAAIAGDLTAADRVELDLPETGVCGVSAAPAQAAGAASCRASAVLDVATQGSKAPARCGAPDDAAATPPAPVKVGGCG